MTPKNKKPALPIVARREIDARSGIARQDMAIGLAAIFRPRLRGKRTVVEVRQAWNGAEIILTAPEMDASDLGVLLSLLHLAGEIKETQAGNATAGLIPGSESGTGKANGAGSLPTITLNTSMAEICRTLGRDPEDGRAHRMIRSALRCLSMVVVEVQGGADWRQTHLITGAAGRGRGAVSVTFSYRLTRALLLAGSYARIDMMAWPAMPPVTQVAYHWLAAWFGGAHGERRISVEKLAAHVWGDAAKNQQQRQNRKDALRRALAALPDGWRGRIEGETAVITACRRQQPVFLQVRTRVSASGPDAETRAGAGFPGAAEFA